MLPTWHRWLKRTFSKTRSLHPIRQPGRLWLEELEDRSVPTVYNVTTTADVVDPNDGLLSLRESHPLQIFSTAQVRRGFTESNTLYKTLPVTMVYSQVFAEVVKQTPDIVNETYDYRFFM